VIIYQFPQEQIKQRPKGNKPKMYDAKQKRKGAATVKTERKESVDFQSKCRLMAEKV